MAVRTHALVVALHIERDVSSSCRSFNNSPIQVLSDFSDSVSKVLATPDEIIASSIDGNVRIFDLRAGKLRCDKFPGTGLLPGV